MRPPPIVNLKNGFCKYNQNYDKQHLLPPVSLLFWKLRPQIVYYQKPNIEDVYAHAPLHG